MPKIEFLQEVIDKFRVANRYQEWADSTVDESYRHLWQSKADAKLRSCIRLARFYGIEQQDIHGFVSEE